MANLSNAKECYDAGREAKRRGFMRTVPYYEHARAEYWWLAGYDGVDFFEAADRQPEFPDRRFSARAIRAIGLPVPEDVAEVVIHPDVPLNQVCGYHTPAATIAAEEELGIFLDEEDRHPWPN